MKSSAKNKLSSDFLSVTTVKKVMPPCIIYVFVQFMTFMIDAILAGHFLGTDAVAAVAIGMPVIGLMNSFTAMIMHGRSLMPYAYGLHSYGSKKASCKIPPLCTSQEEYC